VLLFAEEERVGEDWSLEVTSEQYLYLTSSLNVPWCEIWELCPLLKDTVGDPVNKFVNTTATGLLVCWLVVSAFAAFFSSIKSAFSNVVVFLDTRDLSKEADKTSA